MKILSIFILALATLTFASSDLPSPIRLPKKHPQLYTNLDAYIPFLPKSSAYLQDLLTFAYKSAIQEGIKSEKLSRQAKWGLGKVFSVGHLQDSQSQFFFNFELVAAGQDAVDVLVGVFDHPYDENEDVVFFGFERNVLRKGTFPALQWPVSFSLKKVKNNKDLRSLIRYGIEDVLAQAHKGGVVSSEEYELAFVVSVSSDVVDDVTSYFIDVALTLPDLGSTGLNFVIKEDPSKDLSMVAYSLDTIEIIISELEEA